MSAGHPAQTLRDLGERRIVHDLIVPRFPPAPGQSFGIGDDCAVMPVPPPGYDLVFTTDPCPTPVICMLEFPDLYHYGRLTVLINASDLAAMGARPMGLLVSTVMPEEMTVVDYERFLDGLADASHEWSIPVVGGNIKDGPAFTATGSALGAVKTGFLLRRIGARPGDRVCVIGEMGLFWAAVLTRLIPDLQLAGALRTILDQALYKPVARIKEGTALGEKRLVSSCMDSSDGVGACLQELAVVNQVDIVVNSESLNPHPAVRQVAAAVEIDARKLMLAWGNWELICTLPRDTVADTQALMESLGTPCHVIGEVREGQGQVWLAEANQCRAISNFASERFCGTSYFTHGLDAYVHFLRDQPLVTTS